MRDIVKREKIQEFSSMEGIIRALKEYMRDSFVDLQLFWKIGESVESNFDRL